MEERNEKEKLIEVRFFFHTMYYNGFLIGTCLSLDEEKKRRYNKKNTNKMK